MTGSNPLVFYDISSPIQPRSYAPNPSKTRLALSFKGIPFKTTFVDILDVPSVRKSLDCPATRKLDDGSDFYTLPLLRDPASGTVIGDSVDIANYLDDTFPDSGGCLFPTDSTRTGLDYKSPHGDTAFFAPLSVREGSKNDAYAQFNWNVDATFSAHMVLFGHNLPFNPETAEATKAMFAKRAHLSSFDDLKVDGEARQKLIPAFKAGVESLAELFGVHGGGPYLEGEKANYADLVVGGWVNMMSVIMPAEEWREFRKWHGGVFGKLHDALQENYWVCE